MFVRIISHDQRNKGQGLQEGSPVKGYLEIDGIKSFFRPCKISNYEKQRLFSQWRIPSENLDLRRKGMISRDSGGSEDNDPLHQASIHGKIVTVKIRTEMDIWKEWGSQQLTTF